MRLKRLGVLLLLVLMSLSCMHMAVAEENENLLYNPSFEMLGEDGLPAGWYTDAYVKQEGYTTYAVSTDAYDGQRSAVVNNIGENDARFVQNVAVEPETLYCLSGWIKAEEMTDSGHGANLSLEGLYLFSEGIYDADDQWHYVEMYGETGEDQYEITVFARVGGYSGETQGRALFDHLSLRQVDEVPGDQVASLWFKTTAPQVNDDAWEDEDTAVAEPFWPWLLAIAVGYGLLALWMLANGLMVDRRSLIESRKAPAFFWGGLAVAAVARIAVAFIVEGYGVDVNCFRSWGATIARVGPAQFYQTSSFCDYTPAYLYVLGLNHLMARGAAGLAYTHPALGFLVNEAFFHKIIPMTCDMMAAYIIYRFARREKMSRYQAGLMGLFIAFNPAFFINSAAWCQMDSVLCLGLMVVAWQAIRSQWIALLPTYVLCALIKPQALMLGPLGLIVLIVEWVRKPESRKAMMRGLGISAIVAAGIIIPFGIHQEPGWLISLYGRTLASYPHATVNTANLYYLFGGNWSAIANAAGWLLPLCLATGCFVWGMVLFFRQRNKKLGWLEAAMMAAFALAFLVMACVGVSWAVVGTTAMILAFAIVLPMYVRGSSVRNLPLLGGVLFVLLYVIGIKMHERYLFPALLLFAMAFILHRDRRIFALLALVSCTMLVNEGIVLDNSIRLGASLGHLNRDTEWLNILISVLNVLCVPLAVWVGHRICVEGAPEKLRTSVSPLFSLHRHQAKPCNVLDYAPDARLHWNRIDWVLMIAVTLVYSVVALWNLGSTKAPQNPWKSTAADEAVVIDLGQHYDDFSMLYFAQVSYHDFTVSVSDDQEDWPESYWAQMAQGQCFRWKYLMPSWMDENGVRVYSGGNTLNSVQRLSGRYVRITARQIGLILNEVIFRDGSGKLIPASIAGVLNANEDSPLLSDPNALLDEQDTLEGEPDWYTGTYFDEIYHARTAFEHLNGTNPYETSHPPLGKVIMSWFVGLFGMTPFGWRFAGALAGILMLPVMYLLGKQLTKRTDMAFAAMLMLSLDCMHLTQTRIATIDSFPVLFILLSYLFMARFMQRDMVMQPLTKLLPDLALSGLFMGCGIASKWIGVYAGAGLAVLFFWHCGRHIRLSWEALDILRSEEPVTAEQESSLALRDQTTLRRFVVLCLWCVLFFIIVPVVIYLLSYIPHFAYVHKDGLGDFIGMVWRAQEGMFSYHSTPGLGMDHPFYSPWYEWPFSLRPMYYAMEQFSPKEGYSFAIFCFGNPAVWLTGLAGIACTLYVWAKRHCYVLDGSDSTLHFGSEHWSIAPAFILIGLMAQFLPWVLVPRGTYIYHYFASVPFLILGTMMMFHWLSKRWPKTGRILLMTYLVICLIFFIAYYPYASGVLTPDWWLDFMKKFLRIYHS